MSKSSKILLWCLLGVVLVLILSVVLTRTLMSAPDISTSEVWNKIEAGEITKVYIDDYNLNCYS